MTEWSERYWESRWRDERALNAEMLAVLQNMLAAWEIHFHGGPLADEARAAIAKAEGKS